MQFTNVSRTGLSASGLSCGPYTRFYQDTVENRHRWLDGQSTG